MSCAACSARVEKAVLAVPGVTACAVSLLTNSMGVDGTAGEDDIIRAVTDAGYGAAPKSQSDNKTHADTAQNADQELSVLKTRLISSLFFLIALLYLSMGHAMWGWPLPGTMADNPMILGLTQLLLTSIVLVINQKFFINGFRGVLHRAPNMDTLVALGAGAAYVYSTWALFNMANLQLNVGTQAAEAMMHEFYFESAAMIVTLITVGKLLESRSKGKTTDALKNLIKLRPETASILVDNAEKRVAVADVHKGDTVVVHPGETIPVDGIILSGESTVNEAAITGESIPVDKSTGCSVTSATLNQTGLLHIEATRVGEDTTLAQIIQLVSDAAATKAPVAKIADKVSAVFVPTVISIAVITLIIWILAGQTFSFALARAISVLVISCPCALGLATPVAIVVGSGLGARNGILFKTAAALEAAGHIKTIALDKTGTITAGEPNVTNIFPAPNHTKLELLTLAASLEAGSEHPLARAVVKKAEQMQIECFDVTAFKALPGNGVTAQNNNDVLYAGSCTFIREKSEIDPDMLEKIESAANEGKTPILFAQNNAFIGAIAVADTIREDSAKAVDELKSLGLDVVMITGDNEKTAEAIGKQADIDHVIAGVLPDGKAESVTELNKKAPTAMVGDGINDAPALTAAAIGIAVSSGTDVAIDAADIVLMKNSLIDVPAAIRLSRETLRNIHQNLFWAFFYNILGIPLAAGVFIPITGWTLSPMIGAAAMSMSSFFVVTNALRLNLFNIYGRKSMSSINDAKLNTVTIKINGMRCPHCESAVRKALAALPGVSVISVSHTDKNAVITSTGETSNDVIRKTIEDLDFIVVDM